MKQNESKTNKRAARSLTLSTRIAPPRMEKCRAHSCSDRFLKAGLIALLALLLCGAAIGAAGALAGTDEDDQPNEETMVAKVAYAEDSTDFEEFATVAAAVAATGTDPGTGKLLGNTVVMIADSTEPTITVDKVVTIDLGGHVLKMTGTGSVITINEGSASLTLNDTHTATDVHYFQVAELENGKWTKLKSPWTLVASDPQEPAHTIALEEIDSYDGIHGWAKKDSDGEYVYHYVKVTGGCITGGSAFDGGGIKIDMADKFTMNGGNIVGNSATNGGGVFGDSGDPATINDGNIIGNSATNGGGIYVKSSSCSAKVNGGSIIGNSATNGGGVFLNGSWAPLTMQNSSIVGNSATTNGGGVYTNDTECEFKVGGKVVIRDNAKPDGTPNNVHLASTKYIAVFNDLTAGAEIGIASPLTGQFGEKGYNTSTSEWHTITKTDAACFFPDTGLVKATAIDKDGDGKLDALEWDTDPELIKYDGKPFKVSTIRSDETGNPFFDAENNKWLAEYNNGSLIMGSKVTLKHTLEIVAPKSNDKPFTIDLNGQVLQADATAAAATPFSVITIAEGAELKVIDSNTSKKTHYFSILDENLELRNTWMLDDDGSHSNVIALGDIKSYDGADGGWAHKSGGGESGGEPTYDYHYVSVPGGVITGGTGTLIPGTPINNYYGGGVYVNGGTFALSGGNIVGNNVYRAEDYCIGGGVCVEDNGTFVLSGSASIAGNFSKYGGGVCTHGSNSTFNMSGGIVVGNRGEAYGGGVNVHNQTSTAAISDGKIVGNIGGDCGVYVGGIFKISGTPVIKGNVNKNESTSNVKTDGPSKTEIITLAGELKNGAEIHITFPAAAGQFGKVDTSYTNPKQTDANHFVSDSASPVLAAKLVDNGDNTYHLEWVDAKEIVITQPTGGKISVSPNPAAAGMEVTLTAVPDAGYELDKWDVKKTDGTSVTVSGDKFTMPNPLEDVSVSATFKKSVPPTPVPPTTATVTFNVQGHGTAPASQTIEIGGKVTEPEAPSAEYYTFGGWYTNSGCAEDTKWNFDTPVNSDMTLYAKWTIAYYAAKMSTYAYEGGLLPSPVILPEDIPGASYFYSKSADGEEIPWSEVTSTTSLNAGTYYIGANDPEGLKEIHRSVFTVEKASRTAPEFTAVERDGEITLTISPFDPSETYMYCIKEAGEEDKWIPVTKGTTTIAGLKIGTDYEIKVKINAKGNYDEAESDPKTVTTGSTFSVTYNANGGVGTIEPQTGTAEQPVTVASPAGKITREGHDFVAWATDPDGYVKRYNPGDSVYEGVTLYAKWEPQSYTITFNGNGGRVTKTTQTLKYDDLVSTPLDAGEVTRDGYIHSGWALSSTGSAVYAAKQSVQNLGNITLYAVWTPSDKVHTVTVKSSEEQTYIELKQGSATIHKEWTGPSGVTIPGVAEGTYTLVATKDSKKVTRTETITDGDEIYVEFPRENVSSEVVIKTENATPAVAVGGVDTVAEGAAEYGKSVAVKVTVEAKVEGSSKEQQTQIEIEKIKDEADAGFELQYLGITVEKTVTDSSGEKTTPVTSTAKVLEFIIPYDFTGKKQVKLYRCHDGTAEPLREIKSKDDKDDGTYLLDEDNGRIFLYADKFSTYSIGYVSIPPKPSHKSSSQGTSVWATEPVTPEPTVTPTPTVEPTQGPTPGVPTVKPTEQPTPAGKSPAPLAGLLAGLGCAAVLFGLRRK